MSGWHLGPMVALDFETTGLNVEEDRIVTACIGLIDGTGKRKPETIDVVINPGIPIPTSASDIHGWTTERVNAYQGAMKPADGIEFITEMLTTALLDEPSAPLVGHNLGGYDLSLLDRECRRHGVRLPGDRLGPDRPLHVADTFVIAKRYDPYRKTPQVKPGEKPIKRHGLQNCAVLLGLDWDESQAHGSTYDALMSARVAWLMADRKPELARMTLPELHAAQTRWKREQDASLAAYKRQRGQDVTGLDGHWPVRPFDGQMGLAS